MKVAGFDSMSEERLFRVAGVDGCEGGWFVAIVSPAKAGPKLSPPRSGAAENISAKILCPLHLDRFGVAADFAEVLSQTADCELICVDIPIGLSDKKPRRCDILARKILRGKAPSVFPAPVRPCLSAGDYRSACRISLEHCGKKLSRQSFLLLNKIEQVDDSMTRQLQQRVRETHPEICFWALNNRKPTQHKKQKLIGRTERVKLLSPVFSNPAQIVADARKPGKAAPDDVLDALAAAGWVRGSAVTLPHNPELDSKGLRMEIICPVDSEVS